MPNASQGDVDEILGLEDPDMASLQRLIGDQVALAFKVIMGLFMQVRKLRAEIVELNNRINQDSHNSSKPPSRDGDSKPNTNKRGSKKRTKPATDPNKPKKQNGGQPGHEGSRLEPVETPDRVELLTLETSPSGTPLHQVDIIDWESRQVFDIPEIKWDVCELRSAIYLDPVTGERVQAEFPDGVDAPVVYGNRILATLVSLHVVHLVPLKRTVSIMTDLLGSAVSQATVLAAKLRISNGLDNFEDEVKQTLIEEKRLNADETGLRVLVGKMWCHVVSSVRMTFYALHQKRGSEAMNAIGILPKIEGILEVDFLASYRKVCTKAILAFCNSHLVRELTAIFENDSSQQWARKLVIFLYEGLAAKEAAGGSIEDEDEVQEWKQRFNKILKEASDLNPEPPDPPPRPDGTKKRGRKKRTKSRNLIIRLQEHSDGYLRYLWDEQTPFSNNDAERPLRMIKVQQKVSGCFRTKTGAEQFLRIRSYIDTLRKNDKPILEGLTLALANKVPSLAKIVN